MDAAILPGIIGAAFYALAFFVPFVALRRRGFAPQARMRAALSIAAALALGVSAFAARNEPILASVPLAAGLVLLAIAAAPAQGWRLVAPAAGALGLVLLAGMAFGSLHPVERRGPDIPPLPAISVFAWTLLVVGSLALVVPWRWASAVAAAVLWYAIFTSELTRSFYMGAPAVMATAALLSVVAPVRR